MSDDLLTVTGLTRYFPVTRGVIFRHAVAQVRAVDGIDFSLPAGQTLGIVGESGCGKTTTGRMVARLDEPTSGKISFEGTDITHLRTGQMRPLRREIGMIFQDPYSSLNPRHTVGTIIGAPLRVQKVQTEQGVKKAVQELLELVGLNPEHYNRYPHEFSGGQRQRIGVARTLALKPKLIVADEPVSALDVSIQAQVINLLDDLQDELGLSYVIIAHDLAVVRHIADQVAVMYLGKLMETASRDDLYASPRHPYTVALLSAVPVPEPIDARTAVVVGSGDGAASGAGGAAAAADQRRLGRLADVGGEPAARVEPAAGRRVDGAGHVALEHDLLAGGRQVGVGDGHGRQQGLGVGVHRPLVQLLGRRDLDDLPQVHDRDPVRDVPDHAQVVGDEDVGQAQLVLQVVEQVDDLGPDGHVQGRDRLVGDDQPGIQGQGPGHADALALPAGELVRVQACRA